MDTNFLYCFSGIQVWHLEDEFFLVRGMHAAHLVVRTLRTPMTMTFYCTKGVMQGLIDDKPFALSANEALVMLPSQTLAVTYLSDDWCSTLFAMTRDFAEQQNIGEEYLMYDNLLTNPVLHFEEDEMRSMLSLTETFAYTIQQRDNPHQRDILLSLLRINHQLHAGSLHRSDSTPGNRDLRSGSLAMRFNRLLEAHYTLEHHVDFYAGKLALTPMYLSTVLMQATGHTAGWWIDYYLMRDADRYLTQTLMPVQQIAAVLGFADQSAFGKYFRRQRGMSPTDFRTQHNNKNHNNNERQD